MSKAKELAREIQAELPDMGTEEIDMQLRYLVDAVLSEPDKPELKGWIETGESPYRKLLHLYSGKIFEESGLLVQVQGYGEYIAQEISFDNFKQKIKEAS